MQTPASRARRASPRVRATFTAVAAALALSACGGGGGGNDAPTLSVTADTTDTTPSGHGIALHAQLTNSSEVPTWSLDGPGQLMMDVDDGGYTYIPPDEEDDDQGGTATVTVSAAGLTRQVTLNIAAVVVPGHNWATLSAPRPHWQGLATDGTTFVAVGGDGGIWTSTDGAHWTVRDDPAGRRMASVVYGAAGWLAFSYDGTIFRSGDAQTWTPSATPMPGSGPGAHQAPTPDNIQGALYANGRYLVYTLYGGNWTSVDGVNWQASSPPSTGFHIMPGFTTVAGGSGRFVGAESSIPWYSDDGLHWTQLQNGPDFSSAFAGLAHVGNEFYAADTDGVWASPDGDAWTRSSYWPATTGAFPSSISPSWMAAAAGTMYAWGFDNAVPACGAGTDAIASSTDGIAWAYACDALNLDAMEHIAATANVFVGVGGSILSGPDDAHLSIAAPRTYGDLVVADIVGSQYLVGNGDRLLTSTDGVTWTNNYLPDYTSDILVIAHSPSGVIVVGGLANGATMLAYSTDGTTWAASDVAGSDTVFGLTHDGQRFVAMTYSGVASASADGRHWTTVGTTPAPGLGQDYRALAWGDGRYVAVGIGGLVATSTDAKTWTVAPTMMTLDAKPLPLELSSVTYNGHVFIAVGAGGLAATSADGTHWSVAATASTAALKAVAMTPGGEIVIAVGSGGVTQTSADGVHWTLRASPDHRTLNAVAISSDRALAVGNDSFMQLSTH